MKGRLILVAGATAVFSTVALSADDHWTLSANDGDYSGYASGYKTYLLSDGEWTFLAGLGSIRDSKYRTVQVYDCMVAPESVSTIDFSKRVDGGTTGWESDGITTINCKFGRIWNTPISVGADKVGKVILPESGLSLIEAECFYNCTSLTNVAPFLPDSVTTVNEGAFYNCPVEGALSLNGVSGGIWRRTFSGSAITSLSVGDGITDIGNPNGSYEGPFEGCAKLATVTLGSGVVAIGYRTFKDCSSLTSVTPFLPDTVTNVMQQAFLGTAVAGDLSLAGLVNLGGNKSFYATKITSVTFGPDIKVVDDSDYDMYQAGVFAGCTSLTNVTFSEKASGVVFGPGGFQFYNTPKLEGDLDLRCVARIEGRNVFDDCAATNVVFGEALAAVSYQAFGMTAYDQNKLTDIYWRGAPPTALNADNNTYVTRGFFYQCKNRSIVNHVNRDYAAAWAQFAGLESLAAVAERTSGSVTEYIAPWRVPSKNGGLAIFIR